MPAQTFNPNKLEAIRIERGLSRFEVAIQLSNAGHPITDATIRRWEIGESAPGADDLAHLATLYRVPIERFYE